MNKRPTFPKIPRQSILRSLNVTLRITREYEEEEQELLRLEQIALFPTDKLLLKYQRLYEQLD